MIMFLNPPSKSGRTRPASRWNQLLRESAIPRGTKNAAKPARKAKQMARKRRRKANPWIRKHKSHRKRKSFSVKGHRRVRMPRRRRSRSGPRHAGMFKRGPSVYTGNVGWTPWQTNPKRSKRRRSSRGRRNPGRRYSRRGFRGMRNPANAIMGTFKSMITTESLVGTAAGIGGAYAALVLPSLGARIFPKIGELNQGKTGALLNLASTGLVGGLLATIPATRKYARQAVVGGLIVTGIRLAGDIFPAFPMHVGASLPTAALKGLGYGRVSSLVQSEVERRLSSWNSGLEDYPRGMEDYPRGMEGMNDSLTADDEQALMEISQ